MAAMVMLVAVSLLLLAGRQLIAELSRIPANSYYNRHQSQFLSDENGSTYSQEATDRLQRVPHQHRGWLEWRRLATAATISPLANDALATRIQYRNQIANALTQTLARNPVQALGWNHLANVRMPPQGDCENAMAALNQSFTVVPVEPDFLPYRLELAARCPLSWDGRLFDALRTDLLSLYLGQRKYAQSRAFAIWLAERPQIALLVRRLLSTLPEPLSRLERDLKRFSQ
jgi:cytochrome c-type biogenesis protein CcmH/NrfG